MVEVDFDDRARLAVERRRLDGAQVEEGHADAVVEARERGNVDPAGDGSYATLE